jgi:hypothetical protein
MPSAIVTPQGIAEQKRQNDLAKNIAKEIVGSLRMGIVYTPVSLVEQYHYTLHQAVREAMWKLLSDKIIVLTADRHLVLAE